MLHTLIRAATCALAGLVFGASIAAQAADAVHFKPDEFAWEFEQSAQQCIARRSLTAGTRQMQLELRKNSPRDTFQVIVLGEELKATSGPGKIRLSSADKPAEAGLFTQIKLKNHQGGVIFVMAILRNDTDPPYPAGKLWPSEPSSAESTDATAAIGVAEADSLYLDGFFTEQLVLETGPWADILSSMDACTDKLMASWGLQPEIHRSLSRPTQLSNWEEVSKALATLYKRGAINPKASTFVDFRVLVDEIGKATDCYVTPPADPRFSEKVCNIVESTARLEPALASSGQAVSSYFINRVYFKGD